MIFLIKMIEIKVATFNILADLLAYNEFFCEGGNKISIDWNERFPKLLEIFNNIFKECDIFVVQEMDNYMDFCLNLPNNIKCIIPEKNLGIFYNINNIKFIDADYFSVTFLIQNKLITIYPLHLKSGEAYINELKRIEKLKEILDDSINKYNPIILMDSNNSKLYENNYNNQTLSDLIKEYGFIDCFENTTSFECFKMRHRCSDQKSKHYNFMFDRIDKILVRNNVNFEVINKSFGFKKYDKNNYQKILELRENHQNREDLKKYCQDNLSNVKDSLAFKNTKYDFLKELYPNKNSPSDHPPLACKICLD